MYRDARLFKSLIRLCINARRALRIKIRSTEIVKVAKATIKSNKRVRVSF
jgi:hypothetical protein